MRHLMKTMAVTLILGISADAVAALVAFDNMPDNQYAVSIGGANYGPNLLGTTSPATQGGMQFTPLVSGYTISVFAPMSTDFFAPTAFGVESEVTVTLWSDGGDMPLSILESSSRRVSFARGGAILEWTWQGTTLIENGTKYWLIAQTDEPNSVASWHYSAGYWGNDVTASRALDANWQIFFGTGGSRAMRVEVAPVPVPASLPLLIGGLLLAGTLGRRARSH